MDAGSLAAQILVSFMAPTGIGAVFIALQQRGKFKAEANAQNATADETDAKAEVLLSGEALELFRAARADATDARAEAKEARTEAAAARGEAATCRRMAVELWAAIDATDRHMRRLEHTIVDHGGEPPPRPADLKPNIHEP
jgi:hypothetical protein